MDLFTDRSDPTTQNHDFNPGIAENGLFWVVKIPDYTVDVNPGAGKGRMTIRDLEIEDYHDLINALVDGPSLESHVSFDCRWQKPIATTQLRNVSPLEQYTGLFTRTQATVEWSAEEAGFEFHSDPAATSTTKYAEVAEERNGFFLS